MEEMRNGKMHAVQKRPRAWDVSERAAREKKRAAQKILRPAFSAKRLVLVRCSPLTLYQNPVQPKNHSRACHARA